LGSAYQCGLLPVLIISSRYSLSYDSLWSRSLCPIQCHLHVQSLWDCYSYGGDRCHSRPVFSFLSTNRTLVAINIHPARSTRRISHAALRNVVGWRLTPTNPCPRRNPDTVIATAWHGSIQLPIGRWSVGPRTFATRMVGQFRPATTLVLMGIGFIGAFDCPAPNIGKPCSSPIVARGNIKMVIRSFSFAWGDSGQIVHAIDDSKVCSSHASVATREYLELS